MRTLILLLLCVGSWFYPLDRGLALESPAAVPTNPPNAITCLPRSSSVIKARVSKVIDGDTIEITYKGKNYRVRYIGIDTPESVHPNRPVEPFGKEAAAKNKELVSGKEVYLIRDVSQTDKYGRLLRYVIADGIFVNYELVKQGYAYAVTYPPDVACAEAFLAAQRAAQAAGRGLWGSDASSSNPNDSPSGSVPVNPTPPAPAQPQRSGNAPCNCTGSDLDCRDFSSHASAQLVSIIASKLWRHL
jgi:micrococcal nuclease